MHPRMSHFQTDAQQAARRPIVVLLVDDQAFVGMAVTRLLAPEQDIEVHYCRDPREAIEHANRLAPTVILQDLVMPEVDGLTLVTRYRQNAATAVTPIVVLSGSDDAAARAQAMAAGADDYMVKLPDKGTLSAALRRHHANGQAARASAVDAAAGAAHDAAWPAPGDPLDLAVINAMRDSGTAESTALVAGLIDLFLEDAGALVDRLCGTDAAADAAHVRASAHSLRGSCMTMGARRLGALAAHVEDRARRQPGAAIDPADADAIVEEFARVRAACLEARDGAVAERQN